MKKDSFDQAVDQFVKVELRALDRIIKDIVEPLRVKENPEELLGKPYDAWTPADLQLLTSVYGKDDNTPLANTIFKRTLERVQEMEQEELRNGG